MCPFHAQVRGLERESAGGGKGGCNGRWSGEVARWGAESWQSYPAVWEVGVWMEGGRRVVFNADPGPGARGGMGQGVGGRGAVPRRGSNS